MDVSLVVCSLCHPVCGFILYTVYCVYGSLSTHHGVVLPQLVALQMVALEHHDRPVESGHIQTQIIRPDLLIGRVGENLTATRRESTFEHKSFPPSSS